MIILFGIFFAFLSPSPAKALTTDGRFYFSPDSKEFTKGCESTINIQVSAGSNYSNAANIIVNYNPNEIFILDSDPYTTGTQIQIGSAYSNYADNVVDSSKGKIRLTGFSVSSNLTGTKTFGIIKFKSLPGVDQTSFSIEFTGVGDTLDSNIAETKSSDDILGSVGSANYTFKEGSCFGDTTPPDINPVYPTNYQVNVDKDSEIEVEICDSDSGVDIQTVLIIIDGKEYDVNDINNFFYEGDSSCYTIRIVPLEKFKENTPVLVIFKAADFNGNRSSKTIVFNISPETADCLKQLEQKINELNICKNELAYCQSETYDIQGLPQTGEEGRFSSSFGLVKNIFSIIALIILILHPYWRNPDSEDIIRKIISDKEILKLFIFLIGFCLAILGVIDLISVISILTIVLYISAIFLQLIKGYGEANHHNM